MGLARAALNGWQPGAKMGIWGDGSDCPRVLTPSDPRPGVNGGRGLQVPELTLISLYLGRLGGAKQTDSNICLLDMLNATSA